MDLDDESNDVLDEFDEDARVGANPLAFLGLRRVGIESDESPVKHDPGIPLNRRGIPARKRKKNSLIYGSDDLVSIPVRSPKKKIVKVVTKETEPNKKEVFIKLKDGHLKKIKDEELGSHMNDETEPSDDPEEDDSEVLDEPESPEPVATPSKFLHETPVKVKTEIEDEGLTIPNRLNAQRLGVALRNLLKLPKAHKWVCFEFFYSNIDRGLFHGENDFMMCLKESFPQLKTRRLTRVDWCKVRRLMGKPRRCSEAFFTEERAELQRKRGKIRMLQQRKSGDANSFKDLPEDIPMQLTIGSRVTARLRHPQDGLFTGVIDAIDTSDNTYRVTFDRAGLGTHSIPDYEVLSTEPPDVMPLASFLAKARRPVQNVSSFSSPPKYGSTFSPQLTNDPLLSGSTPRGKSLRLDGTLGGYPVRFLYHIVRLNKALLTKKERVNNLRDLNSDAEKKKSFGEFITEDFQRRYASTVMDIYKINEELNAHLADIAQFTPQFGDESGPSLSLPTVIREGCHEDSYDMVNKYNSQENVDCVQSPKILALISTLTALMLQIKHLADGERNASELRALNESVAEIKNSLNGENIRVFQDVVEVHMQHIQQGLSQVGNLTAFMTVNSENSS